jgi:hypothetical protein
LAAAAVNGAPGIDAKPWHIRISFTLNGSKGKPESEGTFEEFWAAPDKSKRIYTGIGFNQVEYTTPGGVRRAGSRNSAPHEITRIVEQFLDPIPYDPSSTDSAKLHAQDVSLGTIQLSCVAIERDIGPAVESRSDPAMRALWARLIPPTVSTFCLDQSTPVLRMIIAEGGSSRILHNGFTRFANRVLPQSVEEIVSSSPSSEGRQVYRANLELIEPLSSLDIAQFAPPGSALAAPKVIELAERVADRQRVHHSYPQYDYELPSGSRGSHLAGVVVVALLIYTDGSVSPLRAISGPATLRQVSLEAVKKWTYKPFQDNGEPVEVFTTATLVYSLRP